MFFKQKCHFRFLAHLTKGSGELKIFGNMSTSRHGDVDVR